MLGDVGAADTTKQPTLTIPHEGSLKAEAKIKRKGCELDGMLSDPCSMFLKAQVFVQSFQTVPSLQYSCPASISIGAICEARFAQVRGCI